MAPRYAAATDLQALFAPTKFAWTQNPLPARWPDSGRQPFPVCAAVRPFESIIITCLTPGLGSVASRDFSAWGGVFPPFRRASPRGPYVGSTVPCATTTPTPGSVQMVLEPTEKDCESTAAPISPVLLSSATIESAPPRGVRVIVNSAPTSDKSTRPAFG